MNMIIVPLCLYIHVCVGDGISCATQDYDRARYNKYYIYVYSGGGQQVVMVELSSYIASFTYQILCLCHTLAVQLVLL